jgi:hypothetical protein
MQENQYRQIKLILRKSRRDIDDNNDLQFNMQKFACVDYLKQINVRQCCGANLSKSTHALLEKEQYHEERHVYSSQDFANRLSGYIDEINFSYPATVAPTAQLVLVFSDISRMSRSTESMLKFLRYQQSSSKRFRFRHIFCVFAREQRVICIYARYGIAYDIGNKIDDIMEQFQPELSMAEQEYTIVRNRIQSVIKLRQKIGYQYGLCPRYCTAKMILDPVHKVMIRIFVLNDAGHNIMKKLISSGEFQIEDKNGVKKSASQRLKSK